MDISRHPLAIVTAYAELIDQLQASRLVDEFPPGGGVFRTKTIKGRQYVYFQRTTSHGRREQYVGPETADLTRRIAQHDALKASVASRRDLVRALRAARLPAPDRRAGAILAAIADAGVFRMRATLVGTVAYQTYPALLGARLPAQALRTDDIDLAQTWGLSIAVDDRVDAPLIDILQRADKTFRPISTVFHENRPTAYVTDSGFRVELLAANRGAERDAPVRLEALRAYATPLRYLDYLLRDAVPAAILYRDGVLVAVPQPARYACHKLIVAAHRRAGNPKRLKDLAQAEALLSVLLDDQPDDVVEVWRELRRRGPRWRELADRSLDRLPEEIQERLPRR